MVFQQNNVAAFTEALTDVFAQLVTAGNGIGSDLNLRAHLPHSGHQVQIGTLTNDGKRDQCGWMGVKDRSQIRTHLIDSRMERQLRGRSVRSDHSTVSLDAHNIVAVQGALVHACRSDPNTAVFIHDGQITAGGGGHALIINTLHKHNKLICGVNVF